MSANIKGPLGLMLVCSQLIKGTNFRFTSSEVSPAYPKDYGRKENRLVTSCLLDYKITISGLAENERESTLNI